MFENNTSQEQPKAKEGNLNLVAKSRAETTEQKALPKANCKLKNLIDNLGCPTSAATKDSRGKGLRDTSMMSLTALHLSACAILLACSCCLANSSHSPLEDSRFQQGTANRSQSRQQAERQQVATTINSEPFSKIAGLYEQDSQVTPIQGQQSFDRFVQPMPFVLTSNLSPSAAQNGSHNNSNTTATLNHNSNGTSLLQLFDPKNQTINLVQFYMATCPDCQGFSPYFKRLVADIGASWRRLVRIGVVNCNDDLNINLCWQQNPTLLVPLVRWYTFPVILADFSAAAAQSSGADAAAVYDRQLEYPAELLNVAHRSYIERQRRDLISLRHATLRFITSILDQLTIGARPPSPPVATSVANETSTNRSMASSERSNANLNLYKSLPSRWKLMRPIGGQLSRPASVDELTDERRHLFVEQLDERIRDCIQESQLAQNSSSSSISGEQTTISLENFIVFERHNSFAGKTLVADWSNWTCTSELNDININSSSSPLRNNRRLMLVHYTNDFSLLSRLKPLIGQHDGEGSSNSSSWQQQSLSLKEAEAIERAPMLFAFQLISPLAAPEKQTSPVVRSLDELQLRLLSSALPLDSRPLRDGPLIRRRRASSGVGGHSATQTNTKLSSKLSAVAPTKNDHEHQRQAATNYAEGSSSSRLERLSQRKSLEQYYTSRRRSMDSHNRHPLRYAALMAGETGPQTWRKRVRRSAKSGEPALQSRLFIENINWAPEELYPGEETLRYKFNQQVARVLFGGGQESAKEGESGARQTAAQSWPIQVAGFKDGNQAEINITKSVDTNKIVEPKEEDLTMVRLTDYYKVLAEVVHKNMLNKAELDGFQLLASSCFLRTLARNFPFQGGAIKRKSVARNYLELMQRQFLDKLRKRMPTTTEIINSTGGGGDLSLFDPLLACSESGKIHKRRELRDRLSKLKVPSKDLELIQEEVRKKYDVGLPAETHFKWSYCAGSGEYLRGHTCSLWLLFHTLTVQEYLAQTNETTAEAVPAERQFKNNSSDSPSSTNIQKQAEKSIEYKFVVKPNKLCNHAANVEERLLSQSPSSLYVDAPNLVLPTIVNFVRFYMSCTNCASHFSCMVENSELNFTHQTEPGDHLLWLWEGHNRVNLRTKRSHSEDPLHPKHVFPDYEACPYCYLEKPTNHSSADIQSLDSLRFNRQELISFLVARYQRSAILNNKIRIEDLFRKPAPN